MKRKYSLESYNLDWVRKFQDIKHILEKIFTNKFICIEHVGSTSIIGLKAKPLIDVLVVVKKWEGFEKEINSMVEIGYEFQRDIFPPHSLLFFKISDGEKIENIHVFEIGAPKIDEFLNVRDYLRVHPEKAHEYENIKEELVKKYPNDYPAYRQGKGEFLKEINRLAREWRKLSK